MARETYLDIDGMIQPAPAPRFSRTKPDKPYAAKPKGLDTEAILAEYGITPKQ